MFNYDPEKYKKKIYPIFLRLLSCVCVSKKNYTIYNNGNEMEDPSDIIWEKIIIKIIHKKKKIVVVN